MPPWTRNIMKFGVQACFPAGSFLWRLPIEKRAIALTFDDGPHPVYTPKILDLLAMEKCKATFFVIGKNVEAFPELAKRIVDEGHALGLHGHEHREIVGLSLQSLADELNNCRQAVCAATGVDTVLFRPPRGKVSALSILRVVNLGYCLVHWTKSYSDYQQDGVERLMSRMEKDAMRERDIILLHDHNQFTVDALAAVIPGIRFKGIQFHSMDELTRNK